MENKKIRVAITHGDTNGVGYELIFKTFAEPEMLELCTPIIYGSPKIAAYHRKALDIQANFTIINDAREAHDGKVNLLPCFDDEVKVDLGTPTPESGLAALRALDKAMTDFRDGAFDVLVSCPLSSDNIHDDGFNFPGLTKYVETCLGDGNKAMEIMLSEEMRVAVEASGTSIKDVAGKLSQECIVSSVKAISASAHRDFGLSNARVAVLALNAGNSGDEERDIIKPAVDTLSESDANVFGPYSAEEIFGTRNYEAFDFILAMYDDQGIIPFHTLNAEDGICYIANLPVVCTAPLVDPQFEIAGKCEADETAFRHAIFAAIDIFRCRAAYDEPMGNPLQKLYHEKRDESEKVRFAIPKKHDNGFKPTQREGRRSDGPRDFKPRFNKQQEQHDRQQTRDNSIKAAEAAQTTGQPTQPAAQPVQPAPSPKPSEPAVAPKPAADKAQEPSAE